MILGTIDLGTYIIIVTNGLFTGLGLALGNYLATKHIIERANKLKKKITKKLLKR